MSSPTVSFTYELRYQGVLVGEADATAYIDEVPDGGWWIVRITLNSVGGEHEVDLVGADFAAERARLYRNRGFCEDAEDRAHTLRGGRKVYAREMARSE